MIEIAESILIKASQNKIFDIISDFDSYPEFLDEMEEVRVIKKSTKSATVFFKMNMMQTVNYTLKFNFNKPESITWSFVEGDSILKENSGSWTLSEMGKDEMDVEYSVNLDFNIWLPSSVVKSVLSENLPKMLKKFKVRAES